MEREESVTERLRFAAAVAAAVFVLTLPRLLTHELWRDEAWLWMVIGDSGSLAEMAQGLARNGQGHFFPLLCYLARQVSPSPLAMQLVNLVLASCGAFVFARWAPFGRSDRALFLLGYLPFYEYAVISRHYAAGALLLWLACAAAGRRPALLAFGAALGLLCQTTVYGFILAAAVAAGWLAGRLAERWRGGAPPWPPLPALAGGALLALAGGIAGLFQLIPESGTSYAAGWRFGWRPDLAERVLQMPWRAFAPIPRFELHFWNSNQLDAWPALQAAAGLATLAAATFFLRRNVASLAAWLIGAAGLAAFGYVKFIGVLRHDGHWWLLFAAALWLGGGLPAEQGSPGLAWRRAAFRSLLILHAAVALYASWMDLRHPFSNAERTAGLIRASGLDRHPMLGYREPPAAPVVLYLGQPVFAPSRGIYASYPDWGPLQRDLTREELRCAARALAEREGRDIVLILNSQLPPWPEIEEAGSVVGAIQATEDYHLYFLRLARLPETDPAAGCPGAVPGG